MGEPVEIDLGEQADSWWERYHRFRRMRAQETMPGDPVKPDDEARRQMTDRARNDPQNTHRLWTVDDGERVVGSLQWSHPRADSPEYESNRHLVWLYAGVLGPWRRRGIGTAFLRLGLRLLEEAGAAVLCSYSAEKDGEGFLGAIGLEVKQQGGDNRLDLGAVDWAEIERWDEAAAVKADGVEWEWLEDIVPAGKREEYCAEISRLLNTMPWDEMDHGDIAYTAESMTAEYARQEEGALHHSLVARLAGRIVGMTDVHWEPSRPMRIHQGFTGVDPQARGKGIGTRLKTAMLLYLRRRHPEAQWVDTENADSNGPMLAINHRLGFRNIRSWSLWQGRPAAAAAWLAAR
ncbi:GNAT family N-acetyltransferase [bacterium]|nr:GNAT family N-acetyltransferase [bacterium]